ncbi:MAG TPA: AMP-binding protein [Hyphomicrobiaceae bacterium]|nr:AMP-binding protein [Hyphomicrobiaceae bacterium]
MHRPDPALASAPELRRSTAPALLIARARARPGAIAFRAKHRGIYREKTWAQYAAEVARAAKGLSTLGLKRGERIAIMADACEAWLIADLAAQSLGAIVYGIYPTASAEEVAYQMADGGAVLFIAEDQEYVDKVLPFIDRLPQLKAVLVVDETALFALRHAKLSTFAATCAAGAGADLGWLEDEVDKLSPEAPAFIVYTSGTTGHPKGALISHGKHLAATRSLAAHYPTLAAKPHRTVAYLPLCHVLGRDIAVTLPLITELVPHIGESIEDLKETLFETAPTVFFTVPRYLQKRAAEILVGIAGSSPLKRFAYRRAMAFAHAQVRRRWEGKLKIRDAALARFWRQVMFRPILNKIGFDKLELVICGGAPLPTETASLWQMLGIDVVEMYGQTETAGGIIAGQQGPFARPGDVGAVADGVEVKLAADGEILVRSADLFETYWGKPGEAAAIRGSDGWMHTGDVGEWQSGRLKLIDRARDFLVTSGGKTISPSFIENLLRASPYIAEAIVLGHGRKYLSALIEIDFDTVAEWARSNDVAYRGFTSLAREPRVKAMIAGAIADANARLARVEQIKAFRILPKVLDPEEEGEPVTPTRKVKRAQMLARFKDLVEDMYDDEEERALAAATAGLTA